MTLYDELKSFSLVGFREIYKKFIYIHCRELLDVMMSGELDESITGVIAYCYIDRTEGLSFRPIMVAAMKADTLQVFDYPHQENTIYVLRLREDVVKMSELHDGDNHMYLYGVNPDKDEFFDLSIVDFDTESFAEIKDYTDEIYDAGEYVEELRSDKYTFLDEHRNNMFPDDVKALLIGKENGIEQVWVRLTFVTQDKEIFGELLNEPYRDYGCHEGDLIEIQEVNVEDGKVLVFTGRIAERTE